MLLAIVLFAEEAAAAASPDLSSAAQWALVGSAVVSVLGTLGTAYINRLAARDAKEFDAGRVTDAATIAALKAESAELKTGMAALKAELGDLKKTTAACEKERAGQQVELVRLDILCGQQQTQIDAQRAELDALKKARKD